VSTIHLGVTYAAVATLEASPWKSITGERPYFLYVGLRGSYKNFDNALKAYASRGLLRKNFDLIAFGADEFSVKDSESIRSLGLTHSQVRRLSGDDVLLGRLYGNATALIYPSLYEGFGIPPLEAMSYGCPVLCGNTSSIPEVVGEAGLYFDSANIDSIADAMERIATGPKLRSDLVALGRERVKQFSWDRCAARTLEVYRELAT
jgi:glycosyltransferase involved in cell wall biosynthesis